MYNPLFKYSIIVEQEYFAANRYLIKEWFANNNGLWLWTCISRSFVSDYIVYFTEAEDMVLFMLSFETMPVPDIDTLVIDGGVE